MSYKALYRKWRPLVFEDIVEQEHVVKTLKYSITTGHIVHAYLFCGTRGTGKTTMAQILSRAINCLNPQDGNPCNECEVCRGILSGTILDVIEIDAASNNSVDNIREIREEVIYSPSRAKYKVYIIDEVHMLSQGAFNALLKTLEEPPGHVVFILATTEPHKLPVTILSRCQKYEFRRITQESIVGRLNKISEAQGIVLHKEAAGLIARLADGALRDAISLLDQCMSLSGREISYDDVLSIAGIVNDSFIVDFINAINTKDIDMLFSLVDKLIMSGKDIIQFLADLIFYYRNLLVCKLSKNPCDIVQVSGELLGVMQEQSANISQEEIIYIIKELSSLESEAKWSSHPRILLEVSLVRICENYVSEDNNSILERLAALERKINSSSFAEAPSPSEPIPGQNRGTKTSQKSECKTEPNKGKSIIGQSSPYYWDDLIGELKNMGKMALCTFLKDAKAVELDNGALGIVFSPDKSFIRMNVSKAENIEVLQSILSKKCGRDIEVRCFDEDSFSLGEKKQPVKEKDDLLVKAQKLAKTLDTPLNIIDG
ncbi:MAG: DNA polymerase III subunit gamma/tau [Acetivibrionales bacterium]